MLYKWHRQEVPMLFSSLKNYACGSACTTCAATRCMLGLHPNAFAVGVPPQGSPAGGEHSTSQDPLVGWARPQTCCSTF